MSAYRLLCPTYRLDGASAGAYVSSGGNTAAAGERGVRHRINLVLALVVVAGMSGSGGYLAGWSKARLGQAQTVPAVASTVVETRTGSPAGPSPAVEPARTEAVPVSVSAAPGQVAPPAPVQNPPTPVLQAPAPRPAASRPSVPGASPVPARTTAATVTPAAPSSPTPPASGTPGTNGASLCFDEVHFNFGAVYEGETVEHVFRFTNRGQSELVIDGVSTSCGCTAALASASNISPGGVGEVKVSFRTQGYKGSLVRHVYVASNDPVAPRITLDLEGTVKRDLESDPSFVYWPKVPADTSPARIVRLYSPEGKAFRVLGMTCSSPYVHLTPVTADGAGGYRFEIRLGPGLPVGQVASTIVVDTDSARQPRVNVRLFANVVAAEEASQ